MSHEFMPEDDGGVRIVVDTLASVQWFPGEQPEQIWCAGKVCDCCGEPSVVMASIGNIEGGNAKTSETLKLSDARALARHMLAECDRLEAAGHFQSSETDNVATN